MGTGTGERTSTGLGHRVEYGPAHARDGAARWRQPWARWAESAFGRLCRMTGWLCGECPVNHTADRWRRSEMKLKGYGRGAVVILEALGIVVAYFAILIALSYPVADAAGLL